MSSSSGLEKPSETPYLTRPAAFADKFDKLTQPEQEKMTMDAMAAVDNHAKVLGESTKISTNRGEVKDRRAAIEEIESAFGKFNKSGGVVNDGLTKRRMVEAGRFLAAARTECGRRPMPRRFPAVIHLLGFYYGPKPAFINSSTSLLGVRLFQKFL
jgi:hypothetical protein